MPIPPSAKNWPELPASWSASNGSKPARTLLRRNANLIKEMRVQFKPYQSSPTKHKVWERFHGYTKLIILGQGSPKGDTPTKP